RADAVLRSKHVAKQLTATIDNLRMVAKIRRAVDHAEHFDEPLHAVEVAQFAPKRGQDRQASLAILATLRSELGNLDRVKRLIKVLGMVNCTPDFRDHPQVINGCSELFRDVFGPENGVGSRSAVGMGSLPGNIAVEIEAVFKSS